MAVSPELIDKAKPVAAENGKQAQDHKVENDDRPVECVERVEIADIVPPVAKDRSSVRLMSTARALEQR